MAASPTKAQWRALRRYALAGDKPQAHRLLEELSRAYPEDAEVAAELERLLRGEQLHIAESADERNRREGAEAQQLLLRTLSSYTPKILATLPTAELRVMQRQLQQTLRKLSALRISAPPGTNAYKREIKQQLALRRRRSRRGGTWIICILAAALVLLTAAMAYLRQRTEHIETRLVAAQKAKNWAATQSLLKTADTGIYRLLNRRLPPLIAQVERWQQTVQLNALELRRKLHLYENLEATDTLSLEERADILRRIRALPAEFSAPLYEHWMELCRPIQEALEQQKAAYLAELEEATLPLHFTGAPKQDADMLRKTNQRLRSILSSLNDAQEAYELKPEQLTPVWELLLEIEIYLDDTDQCQLLEARLNAARTCEQLANALAEFRPHRYPPALALAEHCRALPTEQQLAAELRSKRHHIPLQMPADVLAAIIERGPSFTQKYPATSGQVHLMQDVFTSQTLRRKIYEVIHPSGKANYTEQQPIVTDTAVAFELSDLDPEYALSSENRREWKNPQTVWIRSIDTTPLLRTTGITPQHFFLTSNVPDLLGRITAMQSKACPALAKAYLYHTLLELVRLSPQPEIMGLRYSPTLQADRDSFLQLQEQCRVPLSVTCWLQRNSDTLAAEKLYETWFAERRNRDYAEEMSRTLARIMREQPIYLGYVDAQQRPHFRRQQAPGTRIRYMSNGELTSGTADAPLQNPMPFSPIIIE